MKHLLIGIAFAASLLLACTRADTPPSTPRLHQPWKLRASTNHGNHPALGSDRGGPASRAPASCGSANRCSASYRCSKANSHTDRDAQA